MAFARIEIEFIGQPPLNVEESYILILYDGSSIISELAKDHRNYPGILATYDVDTGSYPLSQLALNYSTALIYDYGEGVGAVVQYPINIYIDPANSNNVIVEATESGHYFNVIQARDYIRFKITGETSEFSISSVDVSEAITNPKCTYALFTLNFLNAVYPVELTSPVVKTINNAGEAFFEDFRFSPPTPDIIATDDTSTQSSITRPTVSTYDIQDPIINSNISGADVTVQKTVFPRSANATYEYKITGLPYQASPLFEGVSPGNYDAYVLDSFGCEQSINFDVVGGVIMPPAINWVAKDQRTQVSFKIENPAETTNLRFNLYINIPRIGSVIKKTIHPIETSPDIYKGTFEINNVLWGEIQNYLDNIENYPTYNVPFFTFPGDPDFPLVKHEELLLDYYIDTSYSYTDVDGNVIEASKTDNEGDPVYTRYAMIGGQSRAFRGYLENENLSFIDYLKPSGADDLKFLSWIPNLVTDPLPKAGFPIDENQPCKLWVINNNVLNGMNVKMQVYWTQGAISEVQNVYSLSENFGLFELSCGPLDLRVKYVDLTRTVIAYEVWIENDLGDVKTEKRRFTIDYKYYQRKDIFIFKTSLGVYEVLWAKGRRAEKRKLTLKESDRPLISPVLNKGTIFAERSPYIIPYTHNTGFFPKTLRQWLNDFMISEEVILPANFFLIPVILTSSSYDFGEDDQDLFSMPFSFKVAHLESQYSTTPIIPSPFGDFNIDYNHDYLI